MSCQRGGGQGDWGKLLKILTRKEYRLRAINEAIEFIRIMELPESMIMLKNISLMEYILCYEKMVRS